MIFPSKWQIELSNEQELEEDVELTDSNSRIVMRKSGKTYFQFKLFCEGELVFSLNTDSEVGSNVFIKLMGKEGNKMPWECLLDDANRIE